MVGYLSVSRSLLNVRAGAVSRAAGVWTAILCAATALLFTPLLFYFPRPVLAGLLIFLGLALLREWVWDTFFRLPFREHALIVAILVLIAVEGIIFGVAFGLLVASLFFAYSYSRANYVRHDLSVATHRSNKERTLEATAILQEQGGIGRALCLQGYLFFALASSLVETCRNLIVRDGVRYLVLDFRMVQGMDASAALGLSKLHQLCVRYRVVLIVSGLRPEQQAVLQQMRFLPQREIHVVSDLDRGMEWIENRLLAEAVGAGSSAPAKLAGSEDNEAVPSVDLRDMARDDVKVQVEHGLSAGRLVELHHRHPVGAESRFHRTRDFLHHGGHAREYLRVGVEQIARRLLRHDQRVPRRPRHDIHEHERICVLVDLVGGDFAAQDFGEDVAVVVGHARPPG